MNQHTAGLSTGVAIGTPFVEYLHGINEILHTLTLAVGLVAGVASIVYYWSNRRSRRASDK